ncbi:hypothetical protein AAC387_Pa04g1015 [Persea americana]
MLSVHYIQKGLLFYTPSSQKQPSTPIVHLLKQSLSQALAHFLPLAGHLKTHHPSSSSSSSSLYVFIDCNDVVYYDGHSLPLLAVQVTKLIDGIFIGCSFNHVVGDGTSFTHFLNMWYEITRRGGEGNDCISTPPTTQQWFCDHNPSLVRLPFSEADEFIERFSPPPLREIIFHFTAKSIAQLKAKANKECNSNIISSFQALCALVWRSVTRARKLSSDQMTSCRLAAGNQSRLQPPLPPHYFSNCIQTVTTTTTVAQLLSNDLGWVGWLVHQSVATHTDAVVRGTLYAWVKAPILNHLSRSDGWSMMMGSSPRFDMYGNDFGWGRPVAVRSGYANKFDGKMTSYPEFMNALELYDEFMDIVSHSGVF